MDAQEMTATPEAAPASETAVPPGAEAAERLQVDMLQLAFWLLLGVAVATAVVAIAWPQASGMTGPVVLVAMAAFGIVSLLWIVRGAGRRLGLFPERGAAAAATSPSGPRYTWIDALEEAVLITERGGAPAAANAGYGELTVHALGGVVDASRLIAPDRVFGAHPGLAAPLFRLSKAANAGQARREVLPATAFGPESLPVQYEATVSPLSAARTMWRFRRIQGVQDATGAADPKALYVEDAPLGFFTSRPDGVVTYANAWLRELIGLPYDHGQVRVDDMMRPEFVKFLKRDKKANGVARADLMLRGRDGVETPVQTYTTWSGRGVEAQGRTMVIPSQHGLSSAEDRRMAASASRPPRPDSDPMFDDAPFGAARLEGQSVGEAVLLDANDSLRAMSDGAAHPGVRFADLFAGPDGADALQDLLADAVHKPVALEIARQSDAPRAVNVFVALDGFGKPSVAYVIDITEQKQLEHKLAHAEKMQVVGQLAGGVAHDFNNLLTVIMGRTDVLLNRHPLGDPSYPDLKEIYEHGARAAEFVKSLLAYSRQQTFKQEVVDITRVVADLRRLLRQLLDERIKLDVVHGRDLPRVKADPHQIQTSLINLVTNARDAMLANDGAGGELLIRTSRATAEEAHALGFTYMDDGEYLLVEVTDTGHGMSREVMEKVFEPFFTTKDQGQGTGLGLATVYGIIKQSGGYVCPTSEVGKGTTFRIYLPALSADEAAADDNAAEAIEPVRQASDLAGRGRILLVEDEDGVRGITAHFLVTRGYEVEEACDGEEALEIIEDGEDGFDLIISDVIMPGMDGPTLIKKARDRIKDTRVIFISGYAERDLAKTIDEARNVSFLPKPFTQVQLAERVKEELAKRKETEAA